jgi:hypothetical protein
MKISSPSLNIFYNLFYFRGFFPTLSSSLEYSFCTSNLSIFRKWLLFQVLTKEKWETTGRSGESTERSQNISLIVPLFTFAGHYIIKDRCQMHALKVFRSPVWLLLHKLSSPHYRYIRKMRCGDRLPLTQYEYCWIYIDFIKDLYTLYL